MKLIDPSVLKNYIDNKWVSVQKHPTEDLYIYNYTHKCQYERMWDDVTMVCRGLILDGKGNVIAKPFPKFFNLEEYLEMGSELPIEDFEVFDKLDGSLGILYWDGNKPALATRGSFTSEQAIKGTKILREKYQSPLLLNEGLTFLFEIIYPENRIVVDYKGLEDIVLLTVITTDTGTELSYDALKKLPFPVVERFDGITDVSKIKDIDRGDNTEGFVIKYASGLRLKVKYAEYVRLHRLLTGINSKNIWEILKMGQPLDEYLERVPDEFFQWVRKTAANLAWEFNLIERKASDRLDEIKNLPTRKEQAIAIKNSPVRGVIFKMLDKQPYAEIIWRMCKPTAERAFKEDPDA